VSGPLPALLSRAEYDPPVFYADRTPADVRAALPGLAARGLVREVTPAEFVACEDCGSVSQVAYLGPPGGPRRPYLTCKECGGHEVPAERLRRWAVEFAAPAAAVARDAGATGGPEELVARLLWRLGRVRWGGAAREALFLRYPAWEGDVGVRTALAGRPRSVLLLPTGQALTRWAGRTPNPTFALSDLLLSGEEARFDWSVVETTFAAEAPKKKKPQKRRASRAAAIELVKGVLLEHLRAAKDRVWFSIERGEEPVLLPPPSQRQLARQTGLHEVTVGRCLKDEDGDYLRLLLETATDLEAVKRWVPKNDSDEA
jgi:hypothetical protein